MSETNQTLCFQCRKPTFIPRVNVDLESLYTKLRSDSGPSVSLDVKDLIAQCDRDYEDYKKEIAHFQSRILLIKEQQEQLKFHRLMLQSMAAPIRRVPNETLSLIFEYACDQNLLQETPWCLESEKPPTNLSSPLKSLPASSISATCSRWRAVAISMPSLWSRLKVELTSAENSPKKDNPFTDALQLYLDRSKQCPLDVELQITDENEDPHEIFTLFLLLQHCRRWKTFELAGGYWSPSEQFNSGLEFRQLEKLVFAGYSLHGLDLDVFQKAPKLRELCVGTIDMELSQLPWSKLTSLDIQVKHDPLDKIFDLSPHLSELVLWEQYGYHLSMITGFRTSDKLTSLSLYICKTECDTSLLKAVFASFTFPSLVELHIELGGYDKPYPNKWPRSLFTSFMSRSSCSLTKLSLERLSMSHSDLVSTLGLLLTIREFTFSNYSEFDSSTVSRLIQSLHRLGPTRSTKALLPRLCSLSICYTGDVFDDPAFIEMVSSRWLPDPDYAAKVSVDCLRSVVLQFKSRSVDEAIYQPLLQYLDTAGLMVVVTGMSEEEDEDDDVDEED